MGQNILNCDKNCSGFNNDIHVYKVEYISKGTGGVSRKSEARGSGSKGNRSHYSCTCQPTPAEEGGQFSVSASHFNQQPPPTHSITPSSELSRLQPLPPPAPPPLPQIRNGGTQVPAYGNSSPDSSVFRSLSARIGSCTPPVIHRYSQSRTVLTSRLPALSMDFSAVMIRSPWQ